MEINAKLRTDDFGSSGSRRLVRSGFFPAVIYGKNKNIHIILNAHDFEISLRTLRLNTNVTINVGKESYNCIFKDFQENIMTGKILHADFILQ